MLSKLTDALAGPAQDERVTQVPSTMRYRQLDVEALKRSLKLDERAREQAELGLPAPESESLDATELTVTNLVENETQRQFGQYQSEQQGYSNRLNALGFQNVLVEITQAVESAVSNISTFVHNGVNELFPAKKSVIAAEKKYDAFRAKNSIDWEPHTPDGFWYSIWIVAMLLVEGVANGSLLAQGNDFGLVGGTVEALVIAAVNVLFLGYFAGNFGCRWIWHRNYLVKALGLLFVGALATLSLFWNLGAAHYRRALIGPNPDAAFTDAVKTFRSDLFDIADVQSIALLVIGLIFFILASLDFFKKDDRYPGYGDVARMRNKKLENYTSIKARLLEQIASQRAEAEGAIKETLNDLQKNRNEYSHLQARAASAMRDIETHFTHLEQSANALLTFYRNKNALHRNGKTERPDRFDIAWKLPRPNLDGTNLVGTASNQHIDDVIKAANQKAEEVLKRLYSEYEKEMNEYKKIDDLTETD